MPSAPIAASNLVALATSKTTIHLSWTDNSTDEVAFKIQRKSGSGSYATIGTVGSGVTTYDDNTVVQGVTYTYRIIATKLTQFLRDSFSGSTVDTSLWHVDDPSNIAVAGGVLTFTSTLNDPGFVFTNINTIESFNLTGATASLKVPSYIDNRPEIYASLVGATAVNSPPGNWAIIEFNISGGFITPDWQTLVDFVTGSAEAIDASHRYLRIRESGGTLYWEKSANGSTWVEMWHTAVPFDITDVQIFNYLASFTDAHPSPATLVIDDAAIDIAVDIDGSASNESSETVDSYLRDTKKLKEVIYNYLKSDVPLVNLLGGSAKIYHANPQILPQDYPCVTYRIIGEENEPYNPTTTTGMSRSIVEIQTFTKVTSSLTADAIDDRIFGLLNGRRFSSSSIFVITSFRKEKVPLFEKDANIYRIVSLYEIVNMVK